MRQNETVVDSRVVELTLDNQSFESNATQSISTISKLKKALDFSDAGRSLDDISNASKNIKLDTLANGLQAASQGFSAMEAVAFGALANIGAKISDTALRIGKMFTIDPVTDGFKEYELKMGSVQTIMASTGESLDSVNGYLDELNHYADKTIYSFSDMTNSIGKFTNAGVSLEDAVAAIQGISNEAAVSGANAQQASHAMYNFAQALSSGYVKLIDWKSIENANMATVEFKDQLLETAAEMGTVAKQADGTYKVLTHGSGSKGMKETISATKNFNDSLQQQWMTTDVLTKTLAKYADETSSIGKKAFGAATEVKTFSQLVDTLKEAAGSGWAQTWEILVGDFNEAKELFTYLSDTFGGIIDGMSDFRNNFLKEALGAPTQYVDKEAWENLGLTEKKADALAKSLIELGEASGIKFGGDTVDDLVDSLSQGWLTADKLKEALNFGTVDTSKSVKSLDELHEAALKVIRGGETGYSADMALRYEQLAADGFDPQQVQDYVNTLHKLAGGTWNLTEEIMKEADATVKSTEGMAAKSDEELKALGWTDKEIKRLRKLQKQAKETGTPLNDLITQLETPPKTGRENLFETIKNIFSGVSDFVKTIKIAWKDIFPAVDPGGITKITERIRTMSETFKDFMHKNGMNFIKFFKGLFGVLNIGVRIVKILLTGAFAGLSKVLGFLVPIVGNLFNWIGKLLNGFTKWVDKNKIIENAVAMVGEAFENLGNRLQPVRDKIEGIVKFGKWVVDVFNGNMKLLGEKVTFGNLLKAFEQTKKRVFDELEHRFPVLGKVRKAFTDFGTSIKNTFSNINQKLGDPFGKFLGVLEFGCRIVKLFSTYMDHIGGFSFGNLVKSFGFVKTAVFDYLSDKYPAFGKFREGFNQFVDNVKAKIGAFKDGAKNLFEKIDFTKALDSVKGMKDRFLEFFKGFDFKNPVESLGNLKDKILNVFKDFKFPNPINTLREWLDKIVNFFKNFSFVETIKGLFSSSDSGSEEASTGITEWFEGIAAGIRNVFSEVLPNIWKNITSGLGEAWNVLGGSIGDVLHFVLELLSKAWTFISTAFGNGLDTVKESIKKWFANSSIFDILTNSKVFKNAMSKLKSVFRGGFSSVKNYISSGKTAVGGFLDKIKEFGGIKFSNLKDAFFDLKEKFMAIIPKEIPGVSTLKNLFSYVTDNGKAMLKNLGIDFDSLKDKVLRGLSPIIKKVIKIVQTGDEIRKKVVSIFQGLFSKDFVKTNITKITEGLKALWEAIKTYFSGFGSAFNEFFARVTDMGGFRWDNIGEIFEALKETVGKHITDFTGFDSLKDALSKVWENIKAVFADNGIDIDGIIAKITNFPQDVQNAFTHFTEFKGFGEIEEAFSTFWSNIKQMLADNGLDIDAFVDKLANLPAEIQNAVNGFKDFKGFDGLEEAFAKIWDAIKQILLNNGIDIDAIIEKITSFPQTVADTLAELPGKLSETLGGLSFDIPDAFGKLLSVLSMSSEDIKAIGGDIVEMLGDLAKDAVEALSEFDPGEKFRQFISLFTTSAKDSADDVEKDGNLLIDVIMGVLTRLKEVLTDYPTDKLLSVVKDILMLKGWLDIGVGVKNAGKGFKNMTSGQTFFSQLPAVFEALGKMLLSLLALTALTKTEDLSSAISSVTKLVVAVGLMVALVAGVIGHFKSVSVDDHPILTFFTNIIEKVFIAVVIPIVSKAIRDLASVETEDPSKIMEAAKAITLVIGAALLMSVAISGIGRLGFTAGDAMKGLAVLGTILGVSGLTFGILGLVDSIADQLFKKADSEKNLTYFIDKGADLIIEVARKLGEVIGAIAGGIVGGFKKALAVSGVETAQKVEEFVKTMAPLGDDEHAIDKEAIMGNVKLITETLGEMSEAGLGKAVNDFKTSFLTELMDPNGKAKTSLEVFSESIDEIKSIVNKWNESFPKDGDEALRFDKEGFDALVKSVEEIPDGGFVGLLGRMLGVESATSEFAGDMGLLGDGIKAFADATNGVSIGAEVLTAVRVIGDLAKAAAEVGTEAVFYQPFIDFLMGYDDGKNKRTSVAEALNEFAKDLDLSSDDYNRMSKAARAAANIGTFAATVAGTAFKGSDIADATLVSTFCSNIRAIVDAVTYSASGDYTMVDKLAESITTIANTNLNEAASAFANKEVSGLDKYLETADAIKKNSETVTVGATLDTTQAEKDSEEASSTFATIATNMVAALASTFSSDESKATIDASLKTLIDSAVTSISSQVVDFGLAANNLVAGFTNTLGAFHIRLAVSAAAYSIGRVAVTSLKKALDERSPSHESERIAEFFVKGFTIGVDNHVDDVYRGSHGLGQAAVRGLRTSVRAINAMIDSGLDAQPVIRPVLDLTNIQNGSLALNGMLGGGIPVGVAGNLNAINANVNARTITTNSDILSALTDLGSTLSRRPAQTNQYTINGITYDDGTNVSEAVRSLIHAARIERRV